MICYRTIMLRIILWKKYKRKLNTSWGVQTNPRMQPLAFKYYTLRFVQGSVFWILHRVSFSTCSWSYRVNMRVWYKNSRGKCSPVVRIKRWQTTFLQTTDAITFAQGLRNILTCLQYMWYHVYMVVNHTCKCDTTGYFYGGLTWDNFQLCLWWQNHMFYANTWFFANPDQLFFCTQT